MEKETANSSKIQKELSIFLLTTIDTYKTKNGEINKELSRLKEFESLYSKLSKDNSKLLGEVAKIGNIILENEMLRGQITSLK